MADEFLRLDPRTIVVGRIGGAISVAVLAGIALVALVVTLFASAPSYVTVLFALGAWLAGTALLSTAALVLPAVQYRYASYCVDETGIRIRRGAIWRSEVAVPRSRIQHTDVSQGPIERGFGLATLILHTAGTENDAVSLNGLERDRAYAVRDHLLRSGGDDAV